MSSKNSTIFFVQLAVYKYNFFCFTVERRIQLDKIRAALALFEEGQVTK